MYDVLKLRNSRWSDNPFPHVVIDGMWDPEFLVRCRSEFPRYDDQRWLTYDNPEEVGKKAGGRNLWGFDTHGFFNLVRGHQFTSYIAQASGIAHLTADDIGGGMHITGEGGRLEMHIDFNVHPHLPLERRLNMLVFLNEEWDKDWGGVLYLGSERQVEVMPLFNRTVIFECSDKSYHGHPEPIVGEHYRRSLACYFYAPLREGVLERAHTTVWKPSVA